MNNKSNAGRPKIKVTAEEILAELALERTHEQVARKFGVSVDTIDRRIKKYKESLTKASPVSAQKVEKVEKTEGSSFLVSKALPNGQKKYWYNKDSDTYITMIAGAVEPIVTSGAQHRAIIQAYSEFNGNPSTINQLAKDFNMPKDWLVQYLKIHDITHDGLPFSTEDVKSRSINDLTGDLHTMKRQALQTAINEREWKETKKSADKWDEFEETVGRMADDWANKFSTGYRPKLLSIPSAKDKYSMVVFPTDLHFGKGSWEDEVGENYSREEVSRLLLFHTQKIINKIISFGRPERIYIPFGSDWFHVDNRQGTTTAGTPQDMDGTPGIIFTEGLQLKVEFIDLLRQVAPVTLIPCAGNHDHERSIAMMMYLTAWYRSNKDVEVLTSLRPRNYIKVYSTLMGVTHGSDVKPQQLPALMAGEARELWGSSKHSMWMTGHLHYEQMKDQDGVLLYQVPALGAADRWSEGKGYTLSRAALSAVLIDPQDGPNVFITSPRENIKTVGFRLKNKIR